MFIIIYYCHFVVSTLSPCYCVNVLVATVLLLSVLLLHDDSYVLSDDMLDMVLMYLYSS